jgi:hypothetical protein
VACIGGEGLCGWLWVRRRGDRDGGGRAYVLRWGLRPVEVEAVWKGGLVEHELRLEIGGRASSSRGRELEMLSCHGDWTKTKARDS